LHQLGIKLASEQTPAYNLSGLFYVRNDSDGDKAWGLLTVPNALVRGVFDAMTEPGIELPLHDNKLNAHITVFRPEEIALLGGPAALDNDRGKTFKYTIGRLVSLEPQGWRDMAKAFVLRVHSPELQLLRLSYGLSSRPNNGQFDFHITCGVVRKGVLGRTSTSKNTTSA
jgi:hypothetical protein